jgi:cell wall-associated NlpC family hydrolase
MDGLTAVMSRISEIQTMLGRTAAPATTTTATDGAFASELAAATESSPVAGSGGSAVDAPHPPVSVRTGGKTHTTRATGGTGAAVVADARKYLGIPYVWGGTNPQVGLDCSGLTQRVYADLGVKLPRTAHEQARVGKAVPSLKLAKPGDLLAFHNPATHIAIYIGNGMMIAAPHPGDHVKVEKVYMTPSTIRRIFPDTPVPGPPVVLTAQDTGGLASVPYASLFTAAGKRYGVSPKLLAAVAKVESNFNPHAVSRAGAEGLMQIMPATASSLGINPFDPRQAVNGAARILASHLHQFGTVELALAAYNAGAGAVRRYGGIPPYKQTQAYIPKVEAALAALDRSPGGGQEIL